MSKIRRKRRPAARPWYRRVEWPTAVVVGLAALVVGAIAIWAPAESTKAVLSFLGLVFGAALKGLFDKRDELELETVSPPDAVSDDDSGLPPPPH